MATVYDYTAIPDADWQPLLGGIGEKITGPDEINQAIRIILETPKGSDPLRPDFGSNLPLYVDYPLMDAIPNIITESIQAITAWEPRVKITNVMVDPDAVALGKVSVQIYWTPRAGGDTYMVEIP